jgi:hypothetical protein
VEDDLPSAGELEHLYDSLARGERDQLLEELLVAAAHGGEAMMSVLDVWLLGRALRQPISDPSVAPGSDPRREEAE